MENKFTFRQNLLLYLLQIYFITNICYSFYMYFMYILYFIYAIVLFVIYFISYLFANIFFRTDVTFDILRNKNLNLNI